MADKSWNTSPRRETRKPPGRYHPSLRHRWRRERQEDWTQTTSLPPDEWRQIVQNST